MSKIKIPTANNAIKIQVAKNVIQSKENALEEIKKYLKVDASDLASRMNNSLDKHDFGLYESAIAGLSEKLQQAKSFQLEIESLKEMLSFLTEE